MTGKKIKLMAVVGARPNFMKIAPVMRALKSSGAFSTTLVHTGQHYDEKMSQSFFEHLRIPRPNVDLGVGSGSHAAQTAKIMELFEPVALKYKPDALVVVGDVNSTMACTLVAAKLLIPVAHVEAGLRSRDREMPEEINRLVTDALSDFLFVTERGGRENLLSEGVPDKKIFMVGNVMIDTLVENLKRIRGGEVKHPLAGYSGPYATLTLHRPSNVDDKNIFGGIMAALDEIARDIPIFFPVHPRTLKNIRRFKLGARLREWKPGAAVLPAVHAMEPLGYLEFLAMTSGSKIVLTDSGGIQEETTYLGIPCLTLRENTERPVTIEVGTNVLTGPDPARILRHAKKALAGRWKKGAIPELWDGKAAVRIVKILEKKLATGKPR